MPLEAVVGVFDAAERGPGPHGRGGWFALGLVALAAGLGACRLGGPEPPQVPGGEGLTPAQRWVAAAGSRDTPADTRRDAVQHIAGTPAGGDAVYVALYHAVLREPETDPTVAAACALALAQHGGPEHAPDVARLLNDRTDFTRWQAAVALQRLHAPAVAADLIRVLDDTDADVRTAAAVALGQYPRRDVFDALLRTLEDPDYGVARAAEWSLGVMTGYEGGDDPRAWQQLAEARGGDLFVGVLSYTYRRYDGPRRLFRGGEGLVIEGLDAPGQETPPDAR